MYMYMQIHESCARDVIEASSLLIVASLGALKCLT